MLRRTAATTPIGGTQKVSESVRHSRASEQRYGSRMNRKQAKGPKTNGAKKPSRPSSRPTSPGADQKWACARRTAAQAIVAKCGQKRPAQLQGQDVVSILKQWSLQKWAPITRYTAHLGLRTSSVISPPSALQHSTPGFHESSAHPREPSSLNRKCSTPISQCRRHTSASCSCCATIARSARTPPPRSAGNTMTDSQ